MDKYTEEPNTYVICSLPNCENVVAEGPLCPPCTRKEEYSPMSITFIQEEDHPMPPSPRTPKQNLLEELNTIENRLLQLEAMFGDDTEFASSRLLAELKYSYLKARGFALELQDKPEDTK